MSTDLQLRRLDLPKIRLTIPTIKSSLTTPKTDVTDRNDVVFGRQSDSENDDDSCTTPTSKENRIPAILSCPAAPMKPKRVASCKRKLLGEFQFFEVSNREELDDFFRSSSVAISVKRSRCSRK
ncbi:cyclin-dependent protein kinase inhibitor SMR1-like [Quillaja saponaria]|uniref:Cyclin-dependent protein kinase inhibitor SMR1-like n=1 Tax=Quillaja saponaria TaxID=32244 RepID=A0AAD7VGG3_QUISA|nr:cyclin-dependent protein kinase inhibitor SMR1-like [Quillaja saponaria]